MAKLLDIRKEIPVNIEGKLYKQVNITKANAKKDALVLDMKDGLYTRIDLVYNTKHVAIKNNGAVEIGVPFNRLRLLKETKTKTKQL